jgi:hypothetical protein
VENKIHDPNHQTDILLFQYLTIINDRLTTDYPGLSHICGGK